MSKQAAAGIHNILDGILSPEIRPASTLAKEAVAGIYSTHTNPASKTNEKQWPPPAGARRGRPLGKPAATARPKTKVTLWLTTDLVAAYRDWSWEVRCQLSHLIERALAEYRRSHADANSRPDQHT